MNKQVNPRTIWAPVVAAVELLFEQHIQCNKDLNTGMRKFRESREFGEHEVADALSPIIATLREENHLRYRQLCAINLILGGNIAQFHVGERHD